MNRITTSRGLVAGVGILLALSLAAVPAEAQKTKSKSSKSSSKTVRVSNGSSSARSSARSAARSVRKLGSSSSVRTRTRVSNPYRNQAKLGQRPQSSGNVLRYRSSSSARSGSPRRTTSSKLGSGNVTRSRAKVTSTNRDAIRVGSRPDGQSFRNRRDLELRDRDRHRGHARRGHDHGFRHHLHRGHTHGHYRHGHVHGFHSGYHYGYRHGFRDGFRFGLHLGYHRGYACGYGYFGHRCEFTHLGYYYGGFGYFGPYWSFVLVLNAPRHYYGRHDYHYHTFYNGRRTRLYGWDNTSARAADYRFDRGDRACVALQVRTVDGNVLKLEVDPSHYEAQDPGDLYALLWAELEERGELVIETLDGAVHVFPAGQIQQIEAGECGYY